MAVPTSAIDLSSLVYQSAKSRSGDKTQPTQNIFVNVGRDPFKFSLTHDAIDLPDEEVVKQLPVVQVVDSPLGPGQKYSIVVSVSDKRIVDFFSRLDEKNKTTFTANASTFFRKPPAGSMDDIYSPVLRPANERYPASMRAKIITDHTDAAKNTKIFVAEGFATRDRPLTYKPGKLSDVTPGSYVLVIVQCSVAWTQERKCGMSFNATEVFVWPSAASVSGMEAFAYQQAVVSFVNEA